MIIEDNIMNMQSIKTANQMICYKCDKAGHRQIECRSNSNGNFRSNRQNSSRYCDWCENGSHETKFRRNNSAKSLKVNDNDNSFAINLTIKSKIVGVEVNVFLKRRQLEA